MVSICHKISCCSMLLCPGISQKFFCCCRRVVGATVAFLAVAVLAAVPLSLDPTSLVVIISLSSCNPLFWCSLSPMLSKAALPNLFIVVFRNQAEGGPKHARSINDQSNPAHGAQNKGFVQHPADKEAGIVLVNSCLSMPISAYRPHLTET